MKTTPTAEERQGKQWIAGIARTIGAMLLVLWAIEIVNALVGHRLNAWGILPRRVEGLPGVVLAPLLHASFAHLTANSISLALFGTMIAMRSRAELAFVTVGGALVAGIGTWIFGSLFGPLGMHVGASGAGATIKLVNNMLSGTMTAAMAEAVSIAQAAGVDPEATQAVLAEGPVASRLLRTKLPKMLGHDFSAQFQIALMEKDLRYFLALAQEVDRPAPMASLVRSQFQAARRAGFGAMDTSALVAHIGGEAPKG